MRLGNNRQQTGFCSQGQFIALAITIRVSLRIKPRAPLEGGTEYFLLRLRYLLPVLALWLLQLGCGDQYRPVANPIVGQGGTPQTAHFAFTVNNNPAGNSSTIQIDVSGDTNLQTQPAGSGAVAEAFLPGTTAALFTANKLADSVSEFTTAINFSPVTTINLPLGSRPIAVGSQRPGSMYALNSGSNANCLNTGSVSVINTSALAVTSTGCVGPNPVAFTQIADGTKIYVANQGDNTLSVFNPDLGTVTAIITQAMGLGLNPVFLLSSSDAGYVFVINKGDGVSPGSMNIIDTTTDTVAATMPLGVAPVYASVDPKLLRLYVANSGSNSITVLDLSSFNISNNPPLSTLATVSVGSGPVGVTALPDGTRFYTANSISNDVTVVSATSFAVLKTITVGLDPVWIASEPTSSKVYTANAAGGSVSIIQTVNDSVVTNMNAPPIDPNCSSSCTLQQPMMILTY